MTRTRLSRFHLPFLFAVVACAVAQAGAASVEAALPPDNEHALEALKNSPRHGEWVDIDLPAADGSESAAAIKLKTWVVYPERKDKAPVVLVIHEIFGLTDWVRAVADQLAAEGFIAIAPDLVSGMGPDRGGTESLGEGVRETIRKLTPEETARRLNAARDYALKLPAAGEKTACIGFCWGGSASFNYAAAQPRLNGAVVYYGTASTDKDVLSKVACPVIGFYGGDDARVTATVEGTAAAMKELNKAFSHHVYDGAGHGFLRQQNGKDGANRKAAEQAWAETIAFLKKNTE